MSGSAHAGRTPAPTNVIWAPRPGWATVRLVGTCADAYRVQQRIF